MNELKTTMRDCICKLIFLKWYCIDEFMLNFFIISSSNSNRGRSDSPRATDVVPLVSIQIVHAGVTGVRVPPDYASGRTRVPRILGPPLGLPVRPDAWS